KHHSAFKAEDWYNWIVLYSLLLLYDYLPIRHIDGWTSFVKATQLCLKPVISRQELEEIHTLFIRFIRYYENFSATEEELHSPFQEYNMIKAEVRKVKQYYATALDLTMNDLITEYIQKYGKLRTKSSVLIGSKLANRGGDVARNNYSIATKLLVDKNAHLSRAPVDFEEHEFYGQILYYLYMSIIMSYQCLPLYSG
ncbi:4145_t:CDS:2, partial [Funneliformis caledonium]